MGDSPNILSADQMQRLYGSFYESSPKLHLDSSKVPQQLRPLLPYAEFWGVADDWTREELVEKAPADVQENLKDVVASFDKSFDDWLAGPEADDPSLSDEYIAFTALRMAADLA